MRRSNYLKFLKYVRTFLITLTPNITPSNIAMPVLNERMIASALLLAGAMGANISRVVAVIAFFWACISFKSFFLRRDISSNVNFCGVYALIIYLFESVKNKLARKFTIGDMMSCLRKIITRAMSRTLMPAIMAKLAMRPPTNGSNT